MKTCTHPTLQFHSGGHFIECQVCHGWWIAYSNRPFNPGDSPDVIIDYTRSSTSDVVTDGCIRTK